MCYFFEFLLTQNPTNHGSLDSSRTYGRVLANLKTGGSTESFLLENDFQTYCIVNFPKIFHPDFGGLKTN